MAAFIKARSDAELRDTIKEMVKAIRDTLVSLVDQPLEISRKPQAHRYTTEDWLDNNSSAKGVIRGALGKDFADRLLLISFDVVDAITLSGYLMMTPEEVIQENRKNRVFDDNHQEAYNEVGNVLCSGIDEILRERIGDDKIELRLQDWVTIEPDDDPDKLASTDLVAYEFELTVGDYPAAKAQILLDPETAKAWNRDKDLNFTDEGEIEEEGADGPEGGAGSAVPKVEPTGVKLAAFLAVDGSAKSVVQIGHSLGLHVEVKERGSVPNPSANHPGIVLIEVPDGDTRRFDWTARLKRQQANTPVVLLVHQPSRARVIKGFMAKANVILAWPCEDDQVRQKLAPLIQLCTPEPSDAS